MLLVSCYYQTGFAQTADSILSGYAEAIGNEYAFDLKDSAGVGSRISVRIDENEAWQMRIDLLGLDAKSHIIFDGEAAYHVFEDSGLVLEVSDVVDFPSVVLASTEAAPQSFNDTGCDGCGDGYAIESVFHNEKECWRISRFLELPSDVTEVVFLLDKVTSLPEAIEINQLSSGSKQTYGVTNFSTDVGAVQFSPPNGGVIIKINDFQELVDIQPEDLRQNEEILPGEITPAPEPEQNDDYFSCMQDCESIYNATVTVAEALRRKDIDLARKLYENEKDSALTNYNISSSAASAVALAGLAGCFFTGPGYAACATVVLVTYAATMAGLSAKYQADLATANQNFSDRVNVADAQFNIRKKAAADAREICEQGCGDEPGQTEPTETPVPVPVPDVQSDLEANGISSLILEPRRVPLVDGDLNNVSILKAELISKETSCALWLCA